MKIENVPNYVFQHPFTCIISGPSKSGKTTLLKYILKNKDVLIDKPPEKIMYCYSRWQSSFNDLVDQVEFNQGLPDVESLDSNVKNLIILDDLMTECNKSNSIQELFTIDSHHKNMSFFYLTQNFFSQGKTIRTISLNSNYIIVLNNPRDRAQFSCLARQVHPENYKFLLDCYHDAVENKHYGYLLLDFTQKIDKHFRVQTDIQVIDDKIKRIIYLP